MRPVSFLALLTLSSSVLGEPGPLPRPVRVDAEGVPLPDGAVARLGSSRFRHDGSPMELVVFSPDGQFLATVHTRGVSVFDTATGRRLHDFRVPDRQSPKSARFLPDGKQLAVGSRGQKAAELTVYALTDGTPASTTKFEGTGQVQVIDVTADGTRALVDDLWGRGIFLWDLRTSKEVWLFEVSEVAFVGRLTPDGKGFGVSYQRKVEFRDAATGKVAALHPVPGPGFGNLYSATVGPDGRAAVRSDTAESLALLDPKGTAPVRTFAAEPGVLRGLISPDGRYLIGCGHAFSPVWDLTAKDDGRPIAKLAASSSGGFSQDGKTLALNDRGFVALYGVGDWRPLPQTPDPPSRVWPVRFTAGGKQVLGHTARGWVRWPATGGPPVRPAEAAVVHTEEQADVSADGRVAVEALYEPGPNWINGKNAFHVTDLAAGRAAASRWTNL